MRDRARGQSGFSLIEIMAASVIGLIALMGILFLYKNQHKNMVLQGAIAEMRMCGQYTLNEAQYYLNHAGLGLPAKFNYLLESGGDLVIRMNPVKKHAAASKEPGGMAGEILYRIPRTDMGLFANSAYAAAQGTSGVVQAAILRVAPKAGDPASAIVTLAGDRNRFSALTRLYPLDLIRLHRCTGIGSDTAEGDFRVLTENPGLRPGLTMDSLSLAEGIESLAYRYFMVNQDSLTALPANLDSLQRLEIRVVAKTLVRNPNGPGDGYIRDTLVAKIGYRRTF